MVHEIGHALGLKHPFEGASTLPASEQYTQYSVMNYITAAGAVPTTPRPYDELAVQHLYGPNVPVSALYPSGYTTAGYMSANPDIAAAFAGNPAGADFHYIVHGVREGRSFQGFDSLRYIASHADLRNWLGTDTAAAAAHYSQFGMAEGRSATLFEPFSYLASHSDLQAGFGVDASAASRHYIQFGANEGRAITFDAIGYLAANTDVLFAVRGDTNSGAEHWLRLGRSEGRAVTGFDAVGYLARYGDLQAAFGTDLGAATRHYVNHGWREGRSPTGTAASDAPALAGTGLSDAVGSSFPASCSCPVCSGAWSGAGADAAPLYGLRRDDPFGGSLASA